MLESRQASTNLNCLRLAAEHIVCLKTAHRYSVAQAGPSEPAWHAFSMNVMNKALRAPQTLNAMVVFAAPEIQQLHIDGLKRAMSLIAAIQHSCYGTQGPHVQHQGQLAVPSTWPADSDSQAVTQQYQPGGPSAAAAAASMSQPGACQELQGLAEAIMQQGCCDEEGTLVHKPFLPGLLTTLTHVQHCSR